jgi:serine phosphatase RsbU (regulator of sigma subunit)
LAIGCWHQGEIVHLARFISAGLHSYINRDAEGEYIILLTSVVEAAQAALYAQRMRKLADRLREEVDSVRRLQESVIPQNMPVPPGYAIAARYESSQIRIVGSRPVVMAGGDYYDVFGLGPHQLVLLVGDASGHGMKACMSIMTMHTLIRMIRGGKYPSTVEFVSVVNRQLCENAVVRDEGGFITLLYCTLDSSRHRLEWTSAGHPMPLIQDLATNEVRKLASDEEGGTPLGIEEDWVYELCSAEMPENSRVLIYTDGLEEAFPAGGDEEQQFGLTGIISTLKETAHLSVEEALERLFADSHAATKGSGRADDTSVLLLERRASA